MRTFDRIPSKDLGQTIRYKYLEETVKSVEKEIPVPDEFVEYYDQGSDGACVGFAGSKLMSLKNGYQLYNPKKLWQMAKEFDGIKDTVFGDSEGTTVDGAMRVLKKIGHVKKDTETWDINQGILTYKWVSTVDGFRTAIANGNPVQFGINWYENFNTPVLKNGQYWIGLSKNLGSIVGGHSILGVSAFDSLDAGELDNTWGRSYPRVKIPYELLQRLMNEYGEAGLITDRTTDYAFKQFKVRIATWWGLKVRNTPSTNGDILGALPYSTKNNYAVVNSITNTDNQVWYQIDYNGQSGFISAQYTKKV